MNFDERQILQIRCLLESLISEREGMIAENTHRALCGLAVAYREEAFANNAAAIMALREHL